ncbi:hypothetical protein [Streptomyces sp. NPDC008121]|uniref:hypothetical protein n=1 Tax=Streptomyces sp. NPDC008121 TaxID=3364809 RepID=UPI0036E5F247
MERASRTVHAAALVVHAAALALVSLCTALLVILITINNTVANPKFYESVLDDNDAYSRIYDQILVDPQLSAVTSDLLARLPVPPGVVSANLKNLVPPSALRELTQQQVDAAVSYVRRGEDGPFRIEVDIEPIANNLASLGQDYFSDLVSSLQESESANFTQFSQQLGKAAVALSHGQRPQQLPNLELTERQADAATTALLRVVPAQQREQLRSGVRAALGDGDIASALAAVGPAAFSPTSAAASTNLMVRADEDGSWDVQVKSGDGREIPALRQAQAISYFLLTIGPGAIAAVAIAALAVALSTGPLSRGQKLTRIGWAITIGAVSVVAALWAGEQIVGEGIYVPPESWPASVSNLISDMEHTATLGIAHTALAVALACVSFGACLTVIGWALARRYNPPDLPRRTALLAWAGAFMALLLATVPAASIEIGFKTQRRCQGDIRLCERPYNDVAYLASHNAMSSTAEHFIGPLQDLDIIGQLNYGVRALLIDIHRWETPESVTERLRASSISPQLQAQIDEFAKRANPPRAGLWLCHAVCRAGATELSSQLRDVGAWLEANPTEVVTMIVQDETSNVDIERAFIGAGLGDFLFTPPADPDGPWPTLGEMIDDGRRLVVFSEKADGPGPWYRNFYRYGMENHYSYARPEDINCSPNRGGTGKELLLMNNFVTNGGGSRADAGVVNRRDWILSHAKACESARNRPVNFIAVDYVNIGQALEAVWDLNDDSLDP